MKLRIGYSPWEGWECSISCRTPWWYTPLLSWLDRWAERFSGWPAVYDRIRWVRVKIAARWWPSHLNFWWEYRAS